MKELPAVQAYLESVIDADTPREGPIPSLLRGFLGGCSGLYDVGLEGYLAAERLGLRRRERLPVPVISIGNLTVGGTGKTPMTATVCRRLQEHGLRVTILSRGHGGASNDVRVVSDASGEIHLSAEEAGDEPVLLASLCPGVPVIVGKDRRLSGREALRRWPVDVFVLDDGFQFWQLARDLDIVLLDAVKPFDNGYPLPRGLLREPARHLKRAGMTVVTRADRLSEGERHVLIDRIHGYAPDLPVYFAAHKAVGFVPLTPSPSPPERGGDSGLLPFPLGRGGEERGGIGSVVALSAIAQPESFYHTLETATDCRVLRKLSFKDHHRFTTDDVATARQAVAETGASALVMTEKDGVKWPREMFNDVPVYALRIEMKIEDEGAFFGKIMAVVGLNRASVS